MIHKRNILDSGSDDQIYTGAATFGVVMSDIKAVIGSIIGLIMIIGGISLIVKKSFRINTIDGNIKSSNCTEVIVNNNITYSCDISVEYTINGKTQTKSFKDTNSYKKYEVNDTVTLWYDPNNNANIDIMSDNLHTLGWGLLILGIFIIIFSILWAYLANKYKPVAAAEGIFSGVNMLAGRGF